MALLALAVVAGGGYALQWQETSALQREIAWLQEESRERAKLRMENERLKAAQTPAAEIARLRADRAAIVRLRGEIEAMKRRTEGRE